MMSGEFLVFEVLVFVGGYDVMVGFGVIFILGFRLLCGFWIVKCFELMLDFCFFCEDI